MPCIDKAHDRVTYDFEITVPRTVDDALGLTKDSTNSSTQHSQRRQTESRAGGSLPMVVVCTGELVEHFTHPLDSSKSVWIYSMQTALNAASVIISVGPFETVPIMGWGRSVSNAINGSSAIVEDEPFEASTQRSGCKGLIFVLPGYKRDVRTTTFFLSQALEFFEQSVGASYPFSSFKLVFIEGNYSPLVTGSTIALAGVELLIDETLIDQVFESRLYLTRSLASQWTDVWIIVGFAGWMTMMFMRKMFGNSEIKYRLQQDVARVCELDVNQPPLCPDASVLGGYLEEDGGALASTINGLISQSFHPNDDPFSARAELITLKSPLVLSMLEKRMGKNLLQKLANRMMLSAMSGEFPTGISTTSFLKMVRKLSGKLEIKEFADQWIFRSGCPVLTIRYHFNRKKMMIELRIKQDCTNDGVVGATTLFSGPFTVRVKEPGGMFDTEVRIEEKMKQYDIVYNTKYKRIRRRAKKNSKRNADSNMNEEEEEDEEMVDADEDDRDADDIQMQDAGGDIIEPDRITFDWIRLDPESIWLCSKSFEQEDFMWNSLLRREKDIGAQCEAIDALSRIQSLASLNTLSAFARDTSHFYHLRIFAVESLSKFNSEELEPPALSSLIKMYTDFFCIPNDDGKIVPRRNDFSTLSEYHFRQAIVRSLATFTDSKGGSPASVRSLLVDLLRFNDNSGNQFADGDWIALLVKLVGDSFIVRVKKSGKTGRNSGATNQSLFLSSTEIEEFDIMARESVQGIVMAGASRSALSPSDLRVFEDAHVQVLRQLSRDKVLPSHANTVTQSCLEVLLKWQLAGLLPINFSLFLGYSRYGNSRQIRRMAVDCLILLSAMGNNGISEYLIHLASTDGDLQLRYHVLRSIVNYFDVSLFGHRSSVMLEHTVSALSKSVGFVAEKAAASLSITGRCWQLVVRLFEMAVILNPDLAEKKPKLTIRMSSLPIVSMPDIARPAPEGGVLLTILMIAIICVLMFMTC
eukprot:jgi/Hompol1/5539/HPOL_004519-RA